MGWAEVAIRAVASFAGLLLWSRILGKKLISQMTFFDFVAGVTMGSLGGSIVLDDQVPLWVALIGLSVFVVCALLVDYMVVLSSKARDILDSEPLLVVRDGKLMEQGMRKARLTVEDLLLQLRKNKVFYLDDVEYAFFENDGTVSVLTKTDAAPATNAAAHLKPPSRGLPHTLVIDGKIRNNALQDIGRDHEWLKRQLASHQVDDVGQVVVAQVDQLGQLYVDVRRDHMQPLH